MSYFMSYMLLHGLDIVLALGAVCFLVSGIAGLGWIISTIVFRCTDNDNGYTESEHRCAGILRTLSKKIFIPAAIVAGIISTIPSAETIIKIYATKNAVDYISEMNVKGLSPESTSELINKTIKLITIKINNELKLADEKE